MASQPIDRLRVGLTVLATLALWSLLLWQHFHQGVPAHHLLDNPDLPVVSNWYGGLLLPVLAWGMLSLTRRRMIKAESTSLMPVIAGLVGGMVLGIAMTVTFFNGHETVTEYLALSVLALALWLPVYRPECLLGFVLGMTVGFGAVLPTLFGSVIALASFLIHRFVGLPLQRLVGLRRAPSPGGSG
ncbi:MAG: hypothetical protein GVY11_05125 [Gammaproteobacteria bacterium]|jgi:hypothetical protein|nr:hypothetical protein [Gammaproteobacteria bacterium]